MYHIFLSYSRIDSDWVDRLHAELESRGFEAWLDRRDLPLNLPWLNQISDAVEECALFVFCESEAASSPRRAPRNARWPSVRAGRRLVYRWGSRLTRLWTRSSEKSGC